MIACMLPGKYVVDPSGRRWLVEVFQGNSSKPYPCQFQRMVLLTRDGKRFVIEDADEVETWQMWPDRNSET
jgi:hypothetical protein